MPTYKCQHGVPIDVTHYCNECAKYSTPRLTPSSDKDRLRELEEYKITSVKIENGTISLCHKAPVIWVEYVDEEVFFWCSECGKLCEWERIKQI